MKGKSGRSRGLTGLRRKTWDRVLLGAEAEVISTLAELRGKRWLCRGHSMHYPSMHPSIDRGPLKHLTRVQKLTLERQSIDLFRDTARYFAHPGEQGALVDEIVTLMVLRHYDVPTRLLDWTKSPYVAAYFAVCDHEAEDGELWSFDYPTYELRGKQQWMKWPNTTVDGSGRDDKFDAKLTAFTVDEPEDWFTCGFYSPGFPRQLSQDGVFTLTSRFGRDHSEALQRLLGRKSCCRTFVIPAALKPALARILREKHGIWQGSLFPDSAGAAATAKSVFRIK